MTARANDTWELSTEDITRLLDAMRCDVLARVKLHRSIIKPVMDEDGVINPMAIEERYGTEGTHQDAVDYHIAMEIFERQDLARTLSAHLPISRAEQVIMDDYIPESLEVQQEEVRKLNVLPLEHWVAALQNREERYARLAELNSPQVILEHEWILILEAKAGVCWQQAQELRQKPLE
jgi:hypothetical protein